MMKVKGFKTLILFTTALFLVGCGNDNPSPEPPGPGPTPTHVDATRIYTISNISTFAKGSSRTISAVAYPNGATKNLKFISSDPSILEPSDNGVILGKNVGTALITVYNDNNNDGQYNDGEPTAYVSYTIEEPDPNISITLDVDEANLGIDQTMEITPSAHGTSFGYYSAYSDNKDVCEAKYNSTTKKVIIRGVRSGTATVSIYNGLYEAKLPVTVSNNEQVAESLAFSEDVINLKVGDEHNFTLNKVPSTSTSTVKSVKSNREDVVEAYSDLIVAKKAGSAIITAETSNGKIARTRVVVSDPSIDHNTGYYDNYYGDLTWTNGADLKAKLHNIIKNKTSLKYDGNWDTNRAADQDLVYHDSVNAVYTEDRFLKTEQSTKFNREHSFPATMMTCLNTGATDIKGRATDFHNLFAAESKNNSARNNMNYGYADPNSLGYVAKDGGCGYQGDSFEPADVDKGKLARAVMYMGVMYDEVTPITFNKPDGTATQYTFNVNMQPITLIEDEVGYNKVKFATFESPKNVGETTFVNKFVDLVRDDHPEASEGELKAFAYTYYLENYCPYSLGNLSTLLKWNSFGVSHLEAQHNEAVYSLNFSSYGGCQGNRNPFIDYPELAEYVYGSLQDKAGSLKNLTPTYLTLNMDKTNEIHHLAFNGTTPSFKVGDELDITKLNIVAVKNDLSEVTPDYTKLHVDAYTFEESDITSGKDITVRNDLGFENLKIHVDVTGEGPGPTPTGDLDYDKCSYKTGDITASDLPFGDGNTVTLTKGGQSFAVTSGLNGPYIRNNSTKGVQIGKANTAEQVFSVGTLTIQSNLSMSNVNGVFFKVGTASGKNYHYVVRVGDQIICQGDTTSADTIEYGASFEDTSYSGLVSIQFSNVNAAIYLKCFGINITQ